jgi:flagellar motor switch protein FliM
MALLRMTGIRAEAAAADVAAVEKAWTLALARAARDEMAVTLHLREFRSARRTLAEVVEMVPDLALIAALDEGSGEATGCIALDAAVMAGMVEALTTGAVTAGAARRPTRTDAALLAPLLDRALAGFEAAAGEAGLADWARGFRFAATVEGGRGLSLLLEDTLYRVLEGEVDLGQGARRGRMLLAVPDGRAAVALPAAPEADARFAEDLAAQVGGAEARLEAVLLRLSLPLGVVMGLRVGQDLALTRADIGRIALEGLDGRKVGAGRLGRQGAQRAVRLVMEEATAPVDLPVLRAERS